MSNCELGISGQWEPCEYDLQRPAVLWREVYSEAPNFPILHHSPHRDDSWYLFYLLIAFHLHSGQHYEVGECYYNHCLIHEENET